MFTGEWKSHIVLACITCEKVILFTRTDKDWEAARRASEKVMDLMPFEQINLHVKELGDIIVNLFIPTVCSSCVGVASWTSLSMSRDFFGNMATISRDEGCSRRGPLNAGIVDKPSALRRYQKDNRF